MYLTIGYPLGYVRGENDETLYRLELSTENSLKGITLTYNEFCLWVRIAKQKKNIEPILTKLLPSLKEKGALIEADTLSELLEKVLPLSPIRQGVGWANETKECISLGKEFIYPTSMQLDIWRSATGATKLSPLFNWLFKKSDEPLEVFEKEYMLAVMELMNQGVLALR